MHPKKDMKIMQIMKSMKDTLQAFFR